MALTYGFYNAVNHDRTYDALQVSQIFDGIIRDGVYSNYLKSLIVKASPTSTANTVIIQPGRAWFNHTWTHNDADLPITAPEPALVLDRIDALVLDINADPTVRENSFVWVQGTAASEPSKPTEFIRTENHNQYPLCYVYRHADSRTISQSDIENVIGTDECPFVTGIMETINTSELIQQWEAQFMDWFDNLHYILDGDVAGHLQTEIDGLTTQNTNQDNRLNSVIYEEATPKATRNYPNAGLPIHIKSNNLVYITKQAISSGTNFVVGGNVVAETSYGKAVSNIKVYVGTEDRKLHFVDITGADTALPFKNIVDLGIGTEFDVSEYYGYETFTADNFVTYMQSMSGGASGSNTYGDAGGCSCGFGATIAKNYNPSTGKLTITGVTASGSGYDRNGVATEHYCQGWVTVTVGVLLIL